MPEPTIPSPSHKLAGLLRAVARDLVALLALLAAIAFTVAHVRPIYTGKANIAQQLVTHVPIVKPLVQPDTSVAARIVQSPQFARDTAAFAADLVRTGRMTRQRADSIAFYAVREAYVRGIPPAVIFGVMLTENAVFASSATSNVGAVGLMQVYPKIWLKALGAQFGTDLAVDSTNLKYGTFILSKYINPRLGQQATTGQVRQGLLRYNGCVHGTNTPNCHAYPNKVAQYVNREAQSLCGKQGFAQCIATRFADGFLGRASQ